jgi:hypothetical protein
MSAGEGEGASALKRCGGRVARCDTGARDALLGWSLKEAP